MYENIIELLNANRLKEAMTQLAAWASPLTQWQLKREIEELQTSYELLLHYVKEGINDPNRASMHRQMKQQAYELTDRVDRCLRQDKGTGAYYDILRTYSLYPPLSFNELREGLEEWFDFPDFSSNPALKKQEDADLYRRTQSVLDNLFDRIWTAGHWSQTEATDLRELYESPKVLPDHRAVIVSAVTLSLLNLFDCRKFLFLCDAYGCYETENSQRALVGIVLTCLMYDRRIADNYPKIKARILQLTQDPEVQEQVFHIHLQLMQSYLETDEVNRKMREDILPGMINNPQMKKGTIDILNLDEEGNDPNPEWETWKDHTDFQQKMEELTHLQQNGADIYMGTFSHLKQYPFFQRTAHWFYRFNPKQPELAELELNTRHATPNLLDTLLRGGTFCHSDKYSFCFTLLQMPQLARQQLMQRTPLPEDMTDEMKERLKEAEQMTRKPAFITRQYIQDLFRYFRLCPKKGDEKNPFQKSPCLFANSLLKSIIEQEKYVLKTADFMSAHNEKEMAIFYYNSYLTHHNPNNVEVLQKQGLLYQEIQETFLAIHRFETADMLAPDDPWTLRHLAQCHTQEHSFEDALEYYQRVESLKPDNLSIALQIGQCLLQLKRYNEALPYFYKVEYLSKNPKKAWRFIAWCSLLNNNLEQAHKYYSKILEEGNPQRDDFLNIGHLYLIQGLLKEAVPYYRRAHSLCKNHEEFRDLCFNDIKLLEDIGINLLDQDILSDALL